MTKFAEGVFEGLAGAERLEDEQGGLEGAALGEPGLHGVDAEGFEDGRGVLGTGLMWARALGELRVITRQESTQDTIRRLQTYCGRFERRYTRARPTMSAGEGACATFGLEFSG